MDAPEIETALAGHSAIAMPRAMQAPSRQAPPDVQDDSPPLMEETPTLTETPQQPPPDEPPQVELPPEQTVEVARPAMTAPNVVARALTIEDVEVEPPIRKETTAPSAAPTPRAKPQPPAKPVQVARPKAQPTPKQAAHRPAQQAAAPVESKGGGEATTSSVAAGTSGATEAGAGVSSVSAENSANLTSLTQAWGDAIRREVERRKPRNTRRSGEVRNALTVGRAGNLLNVKVRRSSGSDSLDRAALKAVRAAALYVAAPSELTNPQYSFVLPITFRR